MRSTVSLAVVLCITVSELPVSAASLEAARQPPAATLDLMWSDLAPVVTGHRVEVYPAKVRGKVVAVTGDALLLRMPRASQPTTVPRTSIELIRLERNRLPWKLGGVLVALSGLVAGTYVAGTVLRATPWFLRVWLGVISAYPVWLWTGYLASRFDTRVTLIRIVP